MRVTTFLVAAAAIAGVALPAAAQTVAGELRCAVKGGFGFVVTGSRAASCTYRRPGLPTEFYTGQINSLGLDIGPTNAVILTYRVLTSNPATPAALQGEFAGPGVGVAVGAGLTSSLLIGGSSSSVTLVPVPNTATTAYTGFNVSANLRQLQLQFAAVEQPSDGGGRRRRRVQRDTDLD